MKKVICVILAVILIFSLAGCGNNNKSGLGVEKVKIGFCGALTGSSANLGLAVLQGLQMAVDEVNRNGGIAGAPVELVTRDDEGDATKNLTYVEELLYKEDVSFMVAAPNSGCCAASLQLICEEKVPEIISSATAASLIDASLYPYVFRVTAPNSLQAEGMVSMAKEGNFSKIVMIGDTTDLGKDGFNSTTQYANQYGVSIADSISFQANDSDLTAVAQAIQQSGADCVLSWATYSDAAKVVKALDRIGYLDDVYIIGYGGMGEPKFTDMISGCDTSKMAYVAPKGNFVLDVGEDRMNETEQKLYEKIGNTFGVYKSDGSGRATGIVSICRAYDSVYMFKWAVEAITHSLDGDAIKEALETHISEYDSPISDFPYVFTADNHEGYNVKDIRLLSLDVPLINEYVNGDVPWVKAD